MIFLRENDGPTVLFTYFQFAILIVTLQRKIIIKDISSKKLLAEESLEHSDLGEVGDNVFESTCTSITFHVHVADFATKLH